MTSHIFSSTQQPLATFESRAYVCKVAKYIPNSRAAACELLVGKKNPYLHGEFFNKMISMNFSCSSGFLTNSFMMKLHKILNLLLFPSSRRSVDGGMGDLAAGDVVSSVVVSSCSVSQR